MEDGDGCPDADPAPTDTDGDGLLDGRDACPAQAEDLDGDADDDGCPLGPAPAVAGATCRTLDSREAGCSGGDARACLWIGVASGLGPDLAACRVGQSEGLDAYPAAVAAFVAPLERACAAGDDAGCATLAEGTLPGWTAGWGRACGASWGRMRAGRVAACLAGDADACEAAARACGSDCAALCAGGAGAACATPAERCAKGDVAGCLRALDGADEAAAKGLLERIGARCDAGDPLACFAVVDRAREGDPPPGPRVFAGTVAACARGDGEACARLDSWPDPPPPPDVAARAVEAELAACEAANVAACDWIASGFAAEAPVPTGAVRSRWAAAVGKACGGGADGACRALSLQGEDAALAAVAGQGGSALACDGAEGRVGPRLPDGRGAARLPRRGQRRRRAGVRPRGLRRARRRRGPDRAPPVPLRRRGRVGLRGSRVRALPVPRRPGRGRGCARAGLRPRAVPDALTAQTSLPAAAGRADEAGPRVRRGARTRWTAPSRTPGSGSGSGSRPTPTARG